MNIFTASTLFTQFLVSFNAAKGVGDRKIALMNTDNWILRLSFAVCIYKIIENDYQSIQCAQALFHCGLSRNTISWRSMIYYTKSFIRQFITCFALIVINWYIFTIDDGGSESVLDQIKDFASLVVIV